MIGLIKRSDFSLLFFICVKNDGNGNTYIMKVPRWLNYFKQKYQLCTLKRYTTLSGTLVFFFIMSLVPLSFWLSLLLGKLPIDVESFLNLPVFESVKGILQYIQKE